MPNPASGLARRSVRNRLEANRRDSTRKRVFTYVIYSQTHLGSSISSIACLRRSATPLIPHCISQVEAMYRLDVRTAGQGDPAATAITTAAQISAVIRELLERHPDCDAIDVSFGDRRLFTIDPGQSSS